MKVLFIQLITYAHMIAGATLCSIPFRVGFRRSSFYGGLCFRVFILLTLFVYLYLVQVTRPPAHIVYHSTEALPSAAGLAALLVDSMK